MAEESFAELFKISKEDSDGAYWHGSGAVSYCWVAHPISAEHFSGKGKHDIADSIGSACGRLPAGATIQFTIMNVRNVDRFLDNYINSGNSSHKWIHQYEIMKMKAFQGWCESMRDTVGSDVTCKEVQILITLTVYESVDKDAKRIINNFKDVLSPTLKDGEYTEALKTLPAHKRVREQATGLKRTLMNGVSLLETAFRTNKMSFAKCPPEMFIRYVRTMIHPKTGAREPIVYDPELYLNEMVCRKRIDTAGRGKYIVSDGVHQGMLTVESYPKVAFAGMLTLNNPAMDDGLSPIDILKDAVITVNCRAVGKEETVAWLDERAKLAGGQDTDKAEDNMVSVAIDKARNYVNIDAKRFMDVSISCKVIGNTEHECEERLRDATEIFQTLGFGMRVEDTNALTLWAEQLPGGFDGVIKDGSLRTRRRRDIFVGAAAPIYMSGVGTRTATYMCFNEHYEPFIFDNFDHPRSFNIATLGEPGSGKSTRMMDFLTDSLRRDDSWAAVIDYGGSFVSTVNMFDKQGHDVTVSLEQKSPNNAFAGPMDTCIPMLLSWIPDLALVEGEPFDPLLKANVEKALRVAYQKKLIKDKPFLNVGDIAHLYKDYFPGNVRKRFSIDPLNETDVINVRDLLKGDEENKPRFQIYFVIRIQGKNTNEYEDLNDIDEVDKAWLNDTFRGYLESDERGVYVLALDRKALESLTTEKFDAAIDNTNMILEAQREEDFKVAIGVNMTVQYDAIWLSAKREKIMAYNINRYGKDHESLEQYINEDMENIDPLEYYRQKEGMVDLQSEVIFSDFIREAKRMKLQPLDDFVQRLSMWYGDGIYGEFFDRPGGVDVSQYKIVNWDFKPVFDSADKAFTRAYLGSTMMRITVFCNSINTLSMKKMIIIDEYQKFKELGPLITEFVESVTLQARKNGYGVNLGTQYFSHLAADNLVKNFQHFFIGAQDTATIRTLADHLNFTPEKMYVASQAKMVPGRYSDFLLFVDATGICQLTRSVQTPFEYWVRTSHGDERRLRQEKIKKYTREQGYTLAHATIAAALELAKQYPRGLVASKTMEIG